MGYLILFAIGIYILYAIIKYISSSPERKRLREQVEARRAENSMIEEILNGFDVMTERQKIMKLLTENLPEGYRCGKRGCGGILLKRSNSFGYICTTCHNIRQRIKA
ncbi:MAG: hypothetical protein Q7R34_04730 [Dehalococcoidia bacterium]|nr:hypothetical protein [Dehalococcoidia bacterium]